MGRHILNTGRPFVVAATPAWAPGRSEVCGEDRERLALSINLVSTCIRVLLPVWIYRFSCIGLSFSGHTSAFCWASKIYRPTRTAELAESGR